MESPFRVLALNDSVPSEQASNVVAAVPQTTQPILNDALTYLD